MAAIGLAFQDELVGSGLQPVDGGLGQERIRELAEPFDGLPVGGDHGGRSAVALHYQFVNVGGVQSIHRLEGKVVQLSRYRGNWTYPEDRIIPIFVGLSGKPLATGGLLGVPGLG